MLSLSTSGHSRFQDKLDKVFWFLLAILPCVLYFFELCFEYVTFYDFMSNFGAFPFIFDILNEVTEIAFDTQFMITPYLAYLVSVEIMHVLFDVIVFIPRFAHKILSKAINFGE